MLDSNLIEFEYLNIIIYIIKIFFINICTLYTSLKLINFNNINAIIIIKSIIFSFIISIIESFIKYRIDSFMSMLFTILLLSYLLSYIVKNKFGHSISVISISLSLNFILFFVATVTSYFIVRILNVKRDIISLLLIIIIYVPLICSLLKLKRLKNGLNFLQKNINDDYFDIIILYICIVILFLTIALNIYSLSITSNLVLGFIVFSIITFVTIQKTLTMYYKQKLLIKDLDDTKAELESKKQDIEKLEKENLELSKASHSIAHKQKVLEYRLNELMMQNETASEIEIASKLKKIKNEYASKAHQAELTKTEISEIDDLLNYMQSECIKNNIIFDVQINGSIFHFINNFISKEDLQILLADLIKNAIIAVNHLPAESTNRSILVKLGLIDNCYSVYVYDSGIEFETATLAKLGKEPATTHKDSGGTGMGFMNIFDTLNKYKASLKIKEIGKPSNDNYTKCIIINFDNLQQYDIESYK